MNIRRNVVVIPVYRTDLSRTELISLGRCLHVLKDEELVLLGPESMDYSSYLSMYRGFSIERFEDNWFTSLESYSALLLTSEFYDRFERFDYMLIHQLDAFVFSNQFGYWCQKGFDYIGAPWRNSAGIWTGVGNGGFSLRRVQSFLRVLKSGLREDPRKYWEYLKVHASPVGRMLRFPRVVGKYIGINNDVHGFIRKFVAGGCPEDMFWGLHATRYDASFAVAPVEEALHFSIEAGLEDVMDRYKEQPPFGCHREWFLEMIDRYMANVPAPLDDYERAVWNMAFVAGIARDPAEHGVEIDKMALI